MKSKNSKRRKARRPPQRHDRAVSAKPHESSQTKNAKPASQPWLRILSHDVELDTNADRSAGVIALVNGRRQVQDEDFRQTKVGASLRGSRKNPRTLDLTTIA
jgi:hypothetical protein